MNRTLVIVRAASILVLVALVIELVTLHWSHPLSFLAFAIIGGAALGAGLLLYVYWMISGHPDEPSTRSSEKE